ncbi:hypothetical protein [Staphylococcus aureus]|uniref:hypothetical protein n=1 Tax=Staphylococcus aureus TaxID=1280 RepID=UPI0013035704|nr:hypothetical protein [Staphylococcus aureus]
MIKLNIKRTQKKIMKGFLNYKRRKKWSYKLRKLSISIVLFLFVCMSYVFLYALNQFSKEINESNNIQDISNIFLFFCYFAVMIEFVRSFILHTDSSIGSFMYKFIKSAIYLTALFFVFSVYFDKKVEEFDNVLFFFLLIISYGITSGLTKIVKWVKSTKDNNVRTQKLLVVVTSAIGFATLLTTTPEMISVLSKSLSDLENAEKRWQSERFKRFERFEKLERLKEIERKGIK